MTLVISTSVKAQFNVAKTTLGCYFVQVGLNMRLVSPVGEIVLVFLLSYGRVFAPNRGPYFFSFIRKKSS